MLPYGLFHRSIIKFSAAFVTVALLWDQTTEAALTQHISLSVALSWTAVGNHFILGTRHKTCRFGEALTQSFSYHSCESHSNPHFFLLPTHEHEELVVHFLHNISHSWTGARIFNAIHFTSRF